MKYQTFLRAKVETSNLLSDFYAAIILFFKIKSMINRYLYLSFKLEKNVFIENLCMKYILNTERGFFVANMQNSASDDFNLLNIS
jgi:hypothetical protein